MLRTDQIITALEVIGNPDSHPAIIVDDALCAKLAVTIAVFPDLEPSSTIPRRFCCIANSFHVNRTRTYIVVSQFAISTHKNNILHTLVARIEAAWLGSIRPSSPNKADLGSSCETLATTPPE